MASTWRTVVRQEVERLVDQRASAEFTRQELLDSGRVAFSNKSADAKTPWQTVSRCLQELRDEGLLRFVRPGQYEYLADSGDEDFRRRVFHGPPPTIDEQRTVVQRWGAVNTRPYQRMFASFVLPNFGHQCAVCRVNGDWWLEAAHLQPVREDRRNAATISNGVCLCRNHHVAMDRGILRIDQEQRVEVHWPRGVEANEETRRVLHRHEGNYIVRPRHIPLDIAALPSRRP